MANEFPRNSGYIIRKTVFIASAVVLAASIVVIAVKLLGAEKLPEGAYITNDSISLSAPPTGGAEAAAPNAVPVWTAHGDYTLERNNDMIGWIKLGDTAIDYPVVQYHGSEFDNNSYHLYRNFDGNNSHTGTLFVDWHTQIVDERRPDNTVIYGHNLYTGAMFAQLVKYFAADYNRDLNTYIKNPTADFTTIYSPEDDTRNTYKIFAGMFVNSNVQHGEVFDYWKRRFFESKAEFYDFVGNVMDRSVFYTDVDLEYGDEILTMSTCYYPFGHDTDRFVVLARRVREGEDTAVDTSKAYINPDPLYFKYYYQVNGGSWKGRNWDLSKVKGFEEFYSQ